MKFSHTTEKWFILLIVWGNLKLLSIIPVHFSCLFIICAQLKIILKKIKYIIKFINKYKLETNIKTQNRQEENWIHVILFSSINLYLHKKFLC